MVTDLYGTLLEEISKTLDLPELVPDAHNTCLIHFQEGVDVQIEPDREESFLIIGTELGEVTPGRFRDDLFRAALIANALPTPKEGIFAFSEKAGKLIFFTKFPLKGLTGRRVAEGLEGFKTKAKLWKEAIASNTVPKVGMDDRGGGGLFGLMR